MGAMLGDIPENYSVKVGMNTEALDTKVRYIELTQGKRAVVDAHNYEELSKYKWQYNQGYATRYGGKDNPKTVFMHRVINKTPKGMLTDHIDRDGLNNLESNLRSATHAQNSQNKSKRTGTNITSKYKGVGWHTEYKKWVAFINRTHLGAFEKETDAALAYNKQAVELFGEYAVLNDVGETL